MQNIPRRLKLLEKKLASLPIDSDTMLVSELDGFVAGILVCSDLIMPSEWLPLIWGGNEDTAPTFENARQAEQLMGLVMEHYNATANDLHASRYAPVFEVIRAMTRSSGSFGSKGLKPRCSFARRVGPYFFKVTRRRAQHWLA